MKLFDLLKSLNTTTATDPDRSAARPNEDRVRLLDELSSLLELLDAPEIAPATMPQPATPISQQVSSPQQAALLNIDAIFEGAAVDEGAPNTSAPVATANHAHAPQSPTHKQLVRSLLDELLPMFEKALGDRLDQLDDSTLEQWTKATSQVAQPPAR